MTTEALPVVYGTDSWSINNITGHPLFPQPWQVLVFLSGNFVVGKGFSSEVDALAHTQFTGGFLSSSGFTGTTITRGSTEIPPESSATRVFSVIHDMGGGGGGSKPTTSSGGAPTLTASTTGTAPLLNFTASWTDPNPLPTTGNWSTSKLYYIYSASTEAGVQTAYSSKITPPRTFNNVNTASGSLMFGEAYFGICAVEYFDPADPPEDKILGPLSNIVDLIGSGSGGSGSGSGGSGSGSGSGGGVTVSGGGTGGSVIILNNNASVPNAASFHNSGFPDSAITSTYTYSNLSVGDNELQLHLMDLAENVTTVTPTVKLFQDLTIPTVVVSSPSSSSPYTAEWLGPNKPSPKSGSINYSDGDSGIWQTFKKWSSNASETPTFVDDKTNANVVTTIDLTTLSPNISSIPSGGDLYYHFAAKDKATNESTVSTIHFKVDKDNPTLADVEFNYGFTNIASDRVYVRGNATDASSGVIYSECSDNSDPIGSPNSGSFLSTQYVSPNVYDFTGEHSISKTSGTFYIHAIDQADNKVTQTFAYTHNGCNVNWLPISADRSQSPFLVSGKFTAKVVGCSQKIKAFFPTTELDFTPPISTFITTSGIMTEYPDVVYKTYIFNSNVGTGVIHLALEDNYIASKTFSFPSIDYSSISAAAPTLSIEEKSNFKFTNKLTNEFNVSLTGGAVTPSGGKDTIIAFRISETPLSTSDLPTYNTATRTYNLGSGWHPVDRDSYNTTASYTFQGGFGTKNVKVYTATFYHTEIGTKQIFSSTPYTIEYRNDFDGPTATNVKINGYNTTPQPGKKFRLLSPPDVSNATITITGQLTDPSKVSRWVINSSNSIPSKNDSTWNIVPDNASHPISFSRTITLSPMNSLKTVYLHAFDRCSSSATPTMPPMHVGNYSLHKIYVRLLDPANVPTPVGISVGDPYNYEGKNPEHSQRKSISSMFGEGTFHTGFIFRSTPEVEQNREYIHEDYRGLRVTDVSTNADENLPTGTLKLSDFLGKRPRLKNLRINSSPSVPQYKGDVRTISLKMDIDTGDNVSANVNSNLDDAHAKWRLTHTDNQANLTTIYNNYEPPNGKISNFTFANEGVYTFYGISSFGPSSSISFRIYAQGAIIPPTQGPPIGPVSVPYDPTASSGGYSRIVVDFDVTQMTAGVDAVFCVDTSGSYALASWGDGIHSFQDKLKMAGPALCTKLKSFSIDSVTNQSDARFAVVGFGSPGIHQGWTTDQATLVSKLSGVTPGGGEARCEAIGKVAEGHWTNLRWRQNVLKIILLFSDEFDSDGWSEPSNPTDVNTGHHSSEEYWHPTGTNWYVNSLVDNEVALVIFDAEKGANGADVGKGDYLDDAVTFTSEYGSSLERLGLLASPADIAAGLDPVFTAYQQNLKFDLNCDIEGIIASTSPKIGSGFHPSGTTAPIPYNKLVAGSPKKAYFDVDLDNDAINSQGTEYISTYVVIYNNSGVPIKQRELIIQLT